MTTEVTKSTIETYRDCVAGILARGTVKDPSDETLLNLYFEGDANAFLEFYRRHSGRVLGFAKKKGLTNEAAEEVRQEAFLRLHRSIHTYEKGRPALTWFFTIVHNCVVDNARTNTRMAKLKVDLLQAESPPPNDDQPDPMDQVQLALKSLTLEQRQVLELKILHEKSFKEISFSLKKNEVSLRKVFERAKSKMKSILQRSE